MDTITIGEAIEKEDFSTEIFEKSNWLPDTKKVPIIPIAHGSTAQAWQVNDGAYGKQIIKTLQLPANLTEEQKKARIVGFLKQSIIIEKIYRRYLSNDLTQLMLSHPQLYYSSRGPIYITDATARPIEGNPHEYDATLAKYVLSGVWEENIFSRLKNALVLALKIIDDLELYHSVDYLHLDLKPENLLKICVEKNSYVVRNLDFSSCVSCDEILTAVKEGKAKLQNSNAQIENEVDKIYGKYFKSSEVYYSPKVTESRIKMLFDTDDERVMREMLFDLDISAVFKIIINYYFGVPNLSSVRCLEKLSADWLENGIPKSLQEYNIYYHIANLLFGDRTFLGAQYKEIKSVRKNIEGIIGIIDKNISTEEGLENVNLSDFNEVLTLFRESESKIPDNLRERIIYAQISPVELIEQLLFE